MANKNESTAGKNKSSTNKNKKVNGMGTKVWFITGASRGFGKAFAQRALEEGCMVAATARKSETVTAALGEHENLLPLSLDVTKQEQIDAAVQAVLDRFGRIDVLLNNAGYGIFGALEEVSDAEVRALFDTNFFGGMSLTRTVLPHMRAQESGRVVFMGSMASFACDPGGSAYDATKFAVAAMSEALALEMKPFGIESMVVEPGMFRTDFFDGSSIRTPEHTIDAYDGTPARGAMDYCLSHNHLQYGDPQKAAAVLYDIVSSEDPLPLWLPIGRDAVKKYERKFAQMVEAIQPYRDRLRDCSFDE